MYIIGRIFSYQTLPSPSSSDDEDGTWSPPASNIAKNNTCIAKRRGRNENHAAIMLRQLRNNEKVKNSFSSEKKFQNSPVCVYLTKDPAEYVEI